MPSVLHSRLFQWNVPRVNDPFRGCEVFVLRQPSTRYTREVRGFFEISREITRVCSRSHDLPTLGGQPVSEVRGNICRVFYFLPGTRQMRDKITVCFHVLRAVRVKDVRVYVWESKGRQRRVQLAPRQGRDAGVEERKELGKLPRKQEKGCRCLICSVWAYTF